MWLKPKILFYRDPSRRVGPAVKEKFHHRSF
jgi:hypothetical protein